MDHGISNASVLLQRLWLVAVLLAGAPIFAVLGGSLLAIFVGTLIISWVPLLATGLAGLLLSTG